MSERQILSSIQACSFDKGKENMLRSVIPLVNGKISENLLLSIVCECSFDKGKINCLSICQSKIPQLSTNTVMNIIGSMSFDKGKNGALEIIGPFISDINSVILGISDYYSFDKTKTIALWILGQYVNNRDYDNYGNSNHNNNYDQKCKDEKKRKRRRKRRNNENNENSDTNVNSNCASMVKALQMEQPIPDKNKEEMQKLSENDLKNDEMTDIDELACSICLSNKKKCLFDKCFHLCVCISCGFDLQERGIMTCPMCREVSTELKIVY